MNLLEAHVSPADSLPAERGRSAGGSAPRRSLGADWALTSGVAIVGVPASRLGRWATVRLTGVG